VSSRPDFHIDQQTDEGRLRLSVAGEVDLESTPRLEAAVVEACGAARTVELDLHEVSFIDSTGIRAVLGAKALCAQRGVEFLMVPSRHQAPHKTFELAGVLDLLPWRSRREE
jgi:anti-sigma B factor antagonist